MSTGQTDNEAWLAQLAAEQSTTAQSIETSYYPSAKLRLIVRFDEFASTAVQTAAPKKPAPVRKGTTIANPPLVASAQGGTYLLQPPSGGSHATGGPQGAKSSADALTYAINGVIPKKATWTQNGIRAASTFSATFKFIDCPFDPRTIRSCGVEFYLGTVSAEDYAAGVNGGTRTNTQVAPQGKVEVTEPLNIIPETYTDSSGTPRTNLRFQGFVDAWEIEWDDGEPIINIECRDNTQLLLDVEAPPALTLSTTLPFDQAVATYLANFPNFNGLSVEVVPAGDTIPSLGAALQGTAFQPQLGPAPAKGGGAGAGSKLAVWDYLTDAAGAIGRILYMDGSTIKIQEPRTLFSNTQGPSRSDDPYQPRLVDGSLYPHRAFLWGRNLGKLKIRRNFSRNAPTNVEVRSYLQNKKSPLVVRFPDPKAQGKNLAVKALPGDGSTDQKWTVWRVKNISDPALLRTIAQNVYVSLGRGEFTIDLSTKNLGSFGAGSLDPEILDMKAGDSFEVLVARGDLYGTLGTTENALLQVQTDFLTRLGFDQDTAKAYAKAYTDAGFQTVYRLKAASYEWDGEDEGVSIDLHGVNYIEVRADAPNPGS